MKQIVCIGTILALIAGSTGCATNVTKFVDGTDGSAITMVDLVPVGMKRDLSAQNAVYSWTGEGAGEWQVGANLDNTDGVEAMIKILGLIGQLAPLLGGSAAATPTTEKPIVYISPKDMADYFNTECRVK